MTISGTIYLNEKTNQHYQFIYATIYEGNFIGLYANFNVENNVLFQVDLKLINYTNKDIFSLKDAKLASQLVDRNSRNIELESPTNEKIKCLSLSVDIAKSDALTDKLSIETNLKLENLKNNYLQVLRKDDDGTDKENQILQIDDCKQDIHIAAPAGKLCPRGYNYMIT